jgi:hypothetical protein
MKNSKTIFSSKNSKIYIFLFLQISKAGFSRCIFSSLKFAAADADVVDVVNAVCKLRGCFSFLFARSFLFH